MFGKSQVRLEDDNLLKGNGRYSGDIQLENMLHGYVLRSSYASGSFSLSNLDEARKLPGIRGIFTIADLDREGLSGLPCMAGIVNDAKVMRHTPQYPVLARDSVKFVGQPVAFIVADTRNQALDAAEAIDLRVDPIGSVTEADDANTAESALVHGDAKDNTALIWQHGEKKQTQDAFDNAKHKVSLDLINNRLIANPMENRVCLGDWQDNRYYLHTPSQGVHIMAKALSKVFGVEVGKFRVVSDDVGGGFGNRTPIYPEHVLVLLASRLLGQPVKWQGERSADGFVGDYHGRDNITNISLAFDEDYHITGLRVESLANLGAFFSFFGPFIPTALPLVIQVGVYKVPTIFVRVKGLFTNTVPVDAYRGAGRPEGLYAIERAIDYAASVLNVDRIALRKKNMIKPDELPWHNPTGTIYDSGNFPLLLQKGIDKADYHGFAHRKEVSRSRGMLRGLGLSYYIEACGAGDGETARLTLTPEGKIEIKIGMHANGQGHRTSLTQIINDITGIANDDVVFIQGDTDAVAQGSSTGGSRMLTEAGSVTYKVSNDFVENARRIVEDALEVSARDVVLENGDFKVAGTDKQMSWQQLGDYCAKRQIMLSIEDKFVGRATFPNGCHVCEVEVDPETGECSVVKYTAVDDFGNVLNPLLLAGQVHGGIAQGLGQALFEHTCYDPSSGSLMSGSLMDYTIPRADSLPLYESSYYEDAPCPNNLLGVKGAGEAGTIAAPPAAISAVVDALSSYGVHHIDMPATPHRIWQIVQKHRQRATAALDGS